jgi:hypothetical protein
MIIKEFYRTRNDGVNLYRSYSNIGVQIRKIDTDEIYDEAIDIADTPFEYEETDLPIDDDPSEATEEDYQSALRNMGVDV